MHTKTTTPKNDRFLKACRGESVDCTPIWLLAETGAVGLLLFLGFYFFVMRALWRKMHDKEGIEAFFAESVFVFLLLFGLMSLFHEILYTRYLWVLMGMGAASVLHNSSESRMHPA